MKPLVSITTATYNSEKTLARTIESVLNQTYNFIEYIIIDGLSNDNTLQVAEQYRARFEQKGISYTIISESDHGMYDAINKGIQRAKGEIIGNINSDDWYEADTVEKVIKKYNETKFDFMYGDLKIISANGGVRIKRAKKSSYVTSRHWNHPTQFATRELYLKEPYKLESMYDDFDLFLRVMRKGYHIEILNEILADFTTEGMSHKRSIQDVIQRGIARYKIYINNGYSKLYFVESFCAEMMKLILG
ncbi:glycosyltransferase [bacterium 1XD21-13]|nr:glycosyltransferase [bacterium 1XD21-13]